MAFLGRSRLAAVLVVLLLCGLGATAASAGATARISVREVAGKLRFVGPETVGEGETLEVVNQTNPLRLGPVTFSLVRPGYLPKTRHAQAICFTPGHICWSIAEWQGVHGEGTPTINPAEAGEPGWDTPGTNSTPGDSWYSGTERGASFAQEVTAKAGTRLWFMDAIHPWLRGTVKVVAPK